MVKPNELYTATARPIGGAGASAYLCATMVPTNLRRYIYYFEAHLASLSVGTTRVQLVQQAATGAPVASGAQDWFQFNARNAGFWKPDELKEDSLPLAIVEASCRTLARSNHTAHVKIIYAEGA